MTTMTKTEVYLMPAALLVGRRVAKPKGNLIYTCTQQPEEGNRVFEGKLTTADKILNNFVYLNANDNTCMVAANTLLRVRVNSEFLEYVKSLNNLKDDVILIKMEGDLEISTTLGKEIESLTT